MAIRYDSSSEPNVEGSRRQCGVWQRHFPPMPCRVMRFVPAPDTDFQYGNVLCICAWRPFWINASSDLKTERKCGNATKTRPAYSPDRSSLQSVMRYKLWRSRKDTRLRNLGPWTGGQDGELQRAALLSSAVERAALRSAALPVSQLQLEAADVRSLHSAVAECPQCKGSERVLAQKSKLRVG
jgi:hypothetical protein